MSPENQGVFQLLEEETQQAIVRKVCLAKKASYVSFGILLYLFLLTQSLSFLVILLAPFMRPNIGLAIGYSIAPEIQAPIVWNNTPTINTRRV